MRYRLPLHQPSPRRSPLRALAAAALTLPLLAACAPAVRDGDAGHAPRPVARIGGPRDPITEAEIARINASDAYDVVRQLRAGFLNSRGITSLRLADGGAWPVVFVDGMYLGTIAELHGIPASDIREVRFLNAGDAMFRYGAGYTAGIIQVTTRR